MIVALPPATLDDLMKVEGKAELINGRIVEYMPTGRKPTRVAKRILFALDPYVEANKLGEAFMDSIGYTLDPILLSGRQTFSPDVSFYSGDSDYDTMGYIEDSPTFAVEVRSENDYGKTANREYADKREDYFEAGTLVLWDVDPIAKTVTKFTKDLPTTPIVFASGDNADAEPAVPGWKVDVDSLLV